MIYFALTLIFIVYNEWKHDRKINKFWKEWENNSFEWKGYRLSKDFYEIVDGKLVQK